MYDFVPSRTPSDALIEEVTNLYLPRTKPRTKPRSRLWRHVTECEKSVVVSKLIPAVRPKKRGLKSGSAFLSAPRKGLLVASSRYSLVVCATRLTTGVSSLADDRRYMFGSRVGRVHGPRIGSQNLGEAGPHRLVARHQLIPSHSLSGFSGLRVKDFVNPDSQPCNLVFLWFQPQCFFTMLFPSQICIISNPDAFSCYQRTLLRDLS